MSRPIIEVNNLSKVYQLGAIGATSLRDELGRVWAMMRGNDEARKQGDFWALRDVSFRVQPGEVVGIIGRNGAGKSTLLKILGRITQQTTGEITLRGRVASLLEVGTGFHPDLTWRENIFLNGAILGMKKAEIARKFDEIVSFAEVEKFIDTPVKRYSSGMYVRLAFAVAAHLEPEILIVDEVLAVGDTAFQKKCLGKMGEVSKEGRTVLFVSHNLAMISSLCEKTIFLNSGRLMHIGPTKSVMTQYLQSVSSITSNPLAHRLDREGDGSLKVVDITIEGTDTDKLIRSTSRLRITIKYQSESEIKQPNFLIGIYDLKNTGLFLLSSDAVGGLPSLLPPNGEITCLTEPINLVSGRCSVNVAVLKGGAMADYIQNAASFEVETADIYGTGKLPSQDWLFLLKHKWELIGGQS